MVKAELCVLNGDGQQEEAGSDGEGDSCLRPSF